MKKQIILLLIFTLIICISCSKKEKSPTSPDLESLELVPLELGKSWTYSDGSTTTTQQIVGYESVKTLYDAWKIKSTMIMLIGTIQSYELWFQDNDTLKIYLEASAGGWLPFKAFVWPCNLNTTKDWGSYRITLASKNAQQGNYTKCLQYNLVKKDNNITYSEYAKPGVGFVKTMYGTLATP